MADEVSRELEIFDETGKITRLTEIVNQMLLPQLFSTGPSTDITARDSTYCTKCNAVLHAVMKYIRTHSRENVLKLLSKLCFVIVSIGNVSFSDEMCTGFIGLNMVSGFL
jgi:hypothetical protein